MDGEYHLRNCLQAMAAVQGSRSGQAKRRAMICSGALLVLVGRRRARWARHRAVELEPTLVHAKSNLDRRSLVDEAWVQCHSACLPAWARCTWPKP